MTKLPALVASLVPIAAQLAATVHFEKLNIVWIVDRFQGGALTSRLATGFVLACGLLLALAVLVLGRRYTAISAAHAHLGHQQLADEQYTDIIARTGGVIC